MAAASVGSISATLCSGSPFALEKPRCIAPGTSCGIAGNASYLGGTRILGVPRLPNRRTKRTGSLRGIRSNAEFYHEGQRFQASGEPSPAGHILLERTNGATLPFATVSVVPREPGLPPPLDSEGLVADGGPVGILEPQEMELWLSEVEWVDPRVDIDPVSVSRAARLQMRVDAAAAAGYPSWQTGPRRLVSSIRKVLPPSIGGSPEGLAGLTAAVVILLAVLWKLFNQGNQSKNTAYGNSPPGSGSSGVARVGGSSYSALQSTTSQVSYRVGGAAQTAERTAQAAKDEAAKRAQAQLADIKKRVENVKQADNKLKQAGKEVKDKVEEGAENVKEGAQAAKEAVQERAEKVEEKVERSTGRSGTGDPVKSVKDAIPQSAQGDAKPEGSSGRGGSGATVISGVEGKSTKGLEKLVKGDVGDPKEKLSAKPVPEKPPTPAPEPARSSFWAGLKKSPPSPPPTVVSGVEGSKPEQLESLVKGTVGKPAEREGVAETSQKPDAKGVSPLQANSADAVLSAGGATKPGSQAPGKSAPQTPLQRNSADAVLTRTGSSLDKEKAALSFAINQSAKPSNPGARGATTQRENVSQRASDLARVLEDAKKRSAEIREAQARSALSQTPTETKTPTKPVEASKTEAPRRPKAPEPPKAAAAPAKPTEAPKPQQTPEPSDAPKPKPTEAATKTEGPRKLFGSELPEALRAKSTVGMRPEESRKLFDGLELPESLRAKSSLDARAEEAPKLFDNVVIPKPVGIEAPKLFENVEVPKPSEGESEEAPKLFENVELPEPKEGGDSEDAPKLFDSVEIPDTPKPNPDETEEAPKLFDSVEVPEVEPSDGSEAPKLFENVKVRKPRGPEEPPKLFDLVELPDVEPNPENGAEAPKLFENVEVPEPAGNREPEETPKLFPDTPEPDSAEGAEPEKAPKLFPEAKAPVEAKATEAAKLSAETKSKGFFGDIFNFGRGKSVAVSQTPTAPLEGADAVMLEAKAYEEDVISSTPTEPVAPPEAETPKPSETSKPSSEAPKSSVGSESPETPKPSQSLKAADEPEIPDVKESSDEPKTPDAPKASDAPVTPEAPKSNDTPKSAVDGPSGGSSPARKGMFADVFNWNRGKNSGTASKSPTAVLVASDGQMLTARASSLDVITKTERAAADEQVPVKPSGGSSSGTPVRNGGQQTTAKPADADSKSLVKPPSADQQAKSSESNGSVSKSGGTSSLDSSPTLPVLSTPPPKPVLSPAPPKPVSASSVAKPIISEAPPKPAVTETPAIPDKGINPAKPAVGSTPTKVVANDTAVFGSPKLPVAKDALALPAGGAFDKKETGVRSEDRKDVTGGDSEEKNHVSGNDSEEQDDLQEAKDILQKILIEDLPLPEPTGKSSQRQRLIAKVQNVLPAVAVSIGAAGGLATGIDGALETVGFAALASFTASTLLWANSREELKKNIEEIKSSKDLVEFLKEKDITPEP